MEVHIAERVQVHGKRNAFIQHLLVDPFARGVDQSVQIDGRSNFQFFEVFLLGWQVEVEDLDIVIVAYHSTVSLRR